MNANVRTLNCPACGAALDVDGTSQVIRCKFCGNEVQISGAVGQVAGGVPTQPVPLSPELEQIRQLARNGKMIEAIKRYRALYEMYNVSLAQAKADLEALLADRWTPPH